VKDQALKQFKSIFDEPPDSAFFGLAKAIHGWDIKNWKGYAKECKSSVHLCCV